LTAYAIALVAIALLYIAGATLGVRLRAGNWVEMTVLILVGLIPFAGLGILMGHLLTPDSIGPAMGGTTALLALLGGVWFPVTGGVMHAVAEGLPSYWLVQAAHVGLGEPGWGARLGGRRGLEHRRRARRGARLPARHPASLRAAAFPGGRATA
jgi:ABC-2 type transport system permease protein